MTLTVGSLFSGIIGGLELGLEWAGFGPVVWQVESSAFCRRVLAKHWPSADRSVEDVRSAGAANLPTVDVVCFGAPCQDISGASRGRGGGLDGPRSGLWREAVRIVGELQPRAIVVENVAGSAARAWVPAVRSALHERGYASVPVLVRACDVGAPFLGARVFVLAKTYGDGKPARPVDAQVAVLQAAANACRRDWGKPPAGALGVDDGVPDGLDRRVALGNAVVPQCAQVAGLVLRQWLGTD